MIRLNVADMSDLELTEHIKALTEERDKREFQRKESAWNDFVDNLLHYLKECGPITICDSCCTHLRLEARDIEVTDEIGTIIVSD